MQKKQMYKYSLHANLISMQKKVANLQMLILLYWLLIRKRMKSGKRENYSPFARWN